MRGLLFTIVSFFFTVLLCITYFTKDRIKQTRNVLYRYLLIVEIFLLVAELISTIWIIYFPYNIIPIIIHRFHWYTGILWFTLLYYYGVVFISEYKGNKLLEIITKDFKSKLLAIVMLISNILFFFLPFSKLETNDNFSYMPGPAAYYVYLHAAFCVFMLLLFFLKNRNVATERTKISVIIILVEIIIEAIFQVFFPTISVAAIGTSIQLFFLYFNIENPDLELIAELESAKEEIDKSSKAKTDFLSNMSHEIRSPMNAIIGFSESLANGNFELSTVKKDINNIKRAGNNLLDIINNILDISKIETGKEVLTPKEYYLDDILSELKNIVETRIGDKPIKYIVNIDDSTPSKYFGDSIKVYQILLNILTNAVKYTEVGKVILSLKYDMDGDYANLHFEISDTGYGIKKEDYDKLFAKFARLDEAKSKEIEGTGLGLLITKNYVDLMGGKIWFESEYQVGTTFYIDLKQKVLDSTPMKDKVETISKDNTVDYIDCSNYKVLLVDDNLLNLKVAHKLISKYNFQIDEVTSGMECMNKLKEGINYDIIFLDHMMPEMDGIEVLHAIKGLRDYKTPIIVALTANAISGVKEMYLNEGFDEYLSKPINISELNKIIKKYFSK